MRSKFLILLGIALVLAVAINNQHNNKVQPKLLPSNLTEDEKFMLNPPPADTSRSAKDKHMQIVAKLAKIGDQFDIKNCQPTPLVLQVKQGSEFKIKNNDNKEITILFDEDHQYKVSANESKTIKADFKYGPGDYGYICLGTGLVGFLHIAP